MLWKTKFLTYCFVYEFDAMLEKGTSLPKRENAVLNPSVLDPNNAIDEEKIKRIHWPIFYWQHARPEENPKYNQQRFAEAMRLLENKSAIE